MSARLALFLLLGAAGAARADSSSTAAALPSFGEEILGSASA